MITLQRSDGDHCLLDGVEVGALRGWNIERLEALRCRFEAFHGSSDLGVGFFEVADRLTRTMQL